MAEPRTNMQGSFKGKLSRYRFEIRHVVVIVTILILFQVILVFFQKESLGSFLSETQSWFQKYYAERLALVTTTNVELLFERQLHLRAQQDTTETHLAYSLNVIFKQQLIHRSVEDICLILLRNHRLYVVDGGEKMSEFFENKLPSYEESNFIEHPEAVNFFLSVRDEIHRDEKIISKVSDEKTFNVLVPFDPDGEYVGVLYMRVRPDFSFLTTEIQSSFDKVALVFSAFIFFGLIAIFVVSSWVVSERDKAQEELFIEHQENLAKQIRLEKESLFTRRIYHTHHKAEKIMGFIKNDVRMMNADNLPELKKRVNTYSNFISRIIYDMKWYDQDMNTIVNPMFHTNINSVIEFIIENVFLRLSSKNEMFEIKADLDPSLPMIRINEFVVWEVLEPLIQNSIDHSERNSVTIKVSTSYDRKANISYIYIEDNGVGISSALLEQSPKGVKKIFLEHESSRSQLGVHSGYGCYIAHQLAVGKCGWGLDVENMPKGGCRFTIKIQN
jgi:Histidine kinase-, DNA gyrase B-, and HSP90-like ATPase